MRQHAPVLVHSGKRSTLGMHRLCGSDTLVRVGLIFSFVN
jgi:hypothetical protein